MHPAPSHLHRLTTSSLRDYRAELQRVNDHEPTEWTIERVDIIDEILEARATADEDVRRADEDTAAQRRALRSDVDMMEGKLDHLDDFKAPIGAPLSDDETDLRTTAQLKLRIAELTGEFDAGEFDGAAYLRRDDINRELRACYAELRARNAPDQI